MTELLDSLDHVADRFGAIVLDQWGVLHDGTQAYPGVIETLTRLRAKGTRLAVLSNSGKRAAPNADRIAAIGYDRGLFDTVMTSGEALWQDMAAGRVQAQTLVPITRSPGDAEVWAEGLDITLTQTVSQADAALLMGLHDDGPGAAEEILSEAIDLGLPILCTNPDRASPRAGGKTVVSPGALAHAAAENGADVRFYGKPHLPVFRALESALHVSPDALLMVGDSPEHDIAGGAQAGWSTLFIRGGLHAAMFPNDDDAGPSTAKQIKALFHAEAAPHPTYSLLTIR